jgi:hypothetical protein
MRTIVHRSDYGRNNFHVERRGETLAVDITYPPASGGVVDSEKVSYVEVDQESVRASGGIRIHFDYRRNGFVIEQRVNWEGIPMNKDGSFAEDKPKYVEVAFAEAFHADSTGLDG